MKTFDELIPLSRKRLNWSISFRFKHITKLPGLINFRKFHRNRYHKMSLNFLNFKTIIKCHQMLPNITKFCKVKVLTCLKYIFLDKPIYILNLNLRPIKPKLIDQFSLLRLKGINLSNIFNPSFIIFSLNKYYKILHYIDL